MHFADQMMMFTTLVVILNSLVVPGNSFTVSSLSSQRIPSHLHVRSSIHFDGGLTSGLISNLAELALKVRLKGQTGVECNVSANSSDLLFKGRVGPVTVKGRGWKSQLGLSCRAIEATVDTCELDVGRILSNRKLVLTTPATGQATIALNNVDFANFITHPYMQPPALRQKDGEKFAFLKEGTVVDASSGNVTFFGLYMGHKWKLILTRGQAKQRAKVIATPEGTTTISDLDATSAELSLAMTNFFNEMKFELDGTWLTFKDMMVTAKGSSPSLMLRLNIIVKKFPSPGLAF
jgi:hypothetical protein